MSLAEGYAAHRDASDGPLKQMWDVGEIVRVGGSRLRVEFRGIEWWYDKQAIRLADSETADNTASSSAASATSRRC